jgi:hypothetical protein
VRSGRRRWTPIAAVIAVVGSLAGMAGCQSATRVIAPRATFQQGEERREVEIRIEPGRDGETKRRRDEVGIILPDSPSRHLATSPENNNGYELSDAAMQDASAFSYSLTSFETVDADAKHQGNKAETPEYNPISNALKSEQEMPDGLGAGLEGAISEAVRQGSAVHVRVTETRPASSYAEQGAGLTSKSDQAAMEFSTGLRSVVLPWGQAEGGTSGFTGKIMGRSVNVLHILGGLTLICAVIPVVMTPRRVGLAAAIAGAGVALIAAGTVAEQAPWVLVLAFVAFLAALGWLGFSAWKAGRLGLVLDRVQLGVEAAPATAGQLVKASIADAAGPAKHVVKREIAASKRRTGSGKSGENTARRAVPPVGTEAAGGP